MNTVSLVALVRAVAALEAAKNVKDLPYPIWAQVMNSHAELAARLETICAQQEVAVLA